MENNRDARRRWLGAIFLGISAVMLVIGETFLSDRLRQSPWFTLIYWILCFLSVALAILIALVDLIVVRRRSLSEHRNLMESTLGKIANERNARLNGKDEEPNSL